MHFVVAGDGEGLEDLRAAAATTALRDRVTFLGWRADVTDVYAACDLVLLTSDNEGMPLSLIEAAAAGRPAVTTDVGSAAEVVRGRSHRVRLSRPTTAALAAAVVRLCLDDAMREQMGVGRAREARPTLQPSSGWSRRWRRSTSESRRRARRVS